MSRSSHSSDLRVGTKMQHTPVRTNSSSSGTAETTAAAPAAPSSSSSFSQRFLSSLPPILRQPLLIRGRRVPTWALVGGGLLLTAALLWGWRRRANANKGHRYDTRSTHATLKHGAD